MRALTWTWTSSPIILILLNLLTSPFLITTTAQRTRSDRPITKAQIEEAVKRWYKPETGNSAAEAVKRITDCAIGSDTSRCLGSRKTVYINEIILRLQIRDLGQDCTSSDEKYKYVLYEGPFNNDAPFSRRYLAWQNQLLDTGLIFCSPFKHLYCSSNSKKCECRPGTVWKKDACSVIAGGNCWLPGVPSPEKNPKLFDPFDQFALTERFRNRGYTEIRKAVCSEDKEGLCTTGSESFLNNLCSNDEIRELDKKMEDHFKDVPRLSFGDSCNLDHETQLFTILEEEVKDYKIRVKKLEAILRGKTQFCDHNRLHVCGSRGKCECKKPAIYVNETCRFKSPHEGCQEHFLFEKMAPEFPGVSQQILSGLRNARIQGCLECDDAKFPSGKFVEPNRRFCHVCNNFGGDRVVVLGKNCDKGLTGLLEGAPPPSLPIDIPDYEKQEELFVQLSEKAKEFQKVFRLEKNSACNYVAELEVYRLIRRIKNVELPEKIFTAKDYKDLMSSMDKLIRRFGARGLCRYRLFGVREPGNANNPPLIRPILLCGPTPAEPICYEPNNTVYLEVLMKRLSGKSSQATPSNPACSPHPRDVFKYAEDEIGNFFSLEFKEIRLRPEAYEYIFNTLENLWIENSQFCNRTGGIKCTKSVDDKTIGPGKCEFSKAYLEEVLAEAEAERLAKFGPTTTSKSSHHSIQNFWPTLLFVLHIIILN